MTTGVFTDEPAFFPVLRATEARKLIFDFAADLALAGADLTLQGTPTVTFEVLPNRPVADTDATPAAIANGTPTLANGNTQAIVPVNAVNGRAGNDYLITVTCQTTDSKLVMTLPGILPIR